MRTVDRHVHSPTRGARAPLGALVLALVVAASAAPAAEAGRYLIEHAGRTTEVSTITVSGDELFELTEVASAFGLRVDQQGRREFVLRDGQGTLRLRTGRALVMVDEQPVLLGREVERRRRRVYVPLDFITRAVARLRDAEARHDATARVIRFDDVTHLIQCEAFADRTRVTLQLDRPAEFSDVVRDGRRRMLVLTNQELPGQVGGCLFDETLADLEVRPSAGQTRLTFFVGSRFRSLKVYDLPDASQLVFDFFNDATQTTLAPTPERQARPRDIFDTVVIDPGHGGDDRGALGPTGLREKDLTLAISQELAHVLRTRAGLRVLLTRDADESRSLIERTAAANQAGADLFLSIHANATVVPNAWGAETFFLSLGGTDEASRTLAAFENDATGVQARTGASAGSDLEILLWDMAQQQYLQESARLADVVQRELNELAGTRDRGVKQADFVVLRGATMPAVLVEVGFLTNPREEHRMRTAAFQQATAEALYRAVIAFRDQRRSRQEQ